MNYSFKKTLSKALKYFVIFALPVLIDRFVVSYPQVAQLTIGACLVAFANYLKVKVGVKLP